MLSSVGKKANYVEGLPSYSLNDPNLGYVDLSLDTKFATTSSRANPKSGRWLFQLNNNLKNIVGYSVLWVNVPFTYHVIDRSCNQFILDNGAARRLISIEPGTYNYVNICLEIKRKLLSWGLSDYEVLINDWTGKLTIYSPSESFTFEISTNLQNNRLIECLGLTPQDYDPNLNQPLVIHSVYGNTFNASNVGVQAHVITSPSTVNLEGDRMIKFYLDPLRQNEFSSAQDESGSQNCIAIIPVNTEFGKVIQYVDQQPQMVPTTINSLDNLTAWVTSGDERLWLNSRGETIPEIELNGQSIRFALRIFMQR